MTRPSGHCQKMNCNVELPQTVVQFTAELASRCFAFDHIKVSFHNCFKKLLISILYKKSLGLQVSNQRSSKFVLDHNDSSSERVGSYGHASHYGYPGFIWETVSLRLIPLI